MPIPATLELCTIREPVTVAGRARFTSPAVPSQATRPANNSRVGALVGGDADRIVFFADRAGSNHRANSRQLTWPIANRKLARAGPTAVVALAIHPVSAAIGNPLERLDSASPRSPVVCVVMIGLQPFAGPLPRHRGRGRGRGIARRQAAYPVAAGVLLGAPLLIHVGRPTAGSWHWQSISEAPWDAVWHANTVALQFSDTGQAFVHFTWASFRNVEDLSTAVLPLGVFTP